MLKWLYGPAPRRNCSLNRGLIVIRAVQNIPPQKIAGDA